MPNERQAAEAPTCPLAESTWGINCSMGVTPVDPEIYPLTRRLFFGDPARYAPSPTHGEAFGSRARKQLVASAFGNRTQGLLKACHCRTCDPDRREPSAYESR